MDLKELVKQLMLSPQGQCALCYLQEWMAYKDELAKAGTKAGVSLPLTDLEEILSQHVMSLEDVVKMWDPRPDRTPLFTALGIWVSAPRL